MKLTIGMIVKNEEKYLERCLTSIKPILDNVDSELIITDTGSTDRTVEISKKFTDKILHFEWVNDFSAARNTTVANAKGEWYMFVDGDDIFESCDDIIKFFNSGEYKNYGSASFIYRNIVNLEKHNFVDQNVIRMTKLFPETRFVGIIHENLFPLMPPIRMISDIVDHYGYLYDNNENPEAKKMKRNEELLLKELKNTEDTNPRHSFIYYYLFESARNVDPEKAEKYLKEGMEDALRTNNDQVLVLLYMDNVGVYFKRNDYNSLLDLCDKYFSLDLKSKNHLSADAEMYAAKALSLSNLEREEDAFREYINFFRAFEDMTGSDNDADKFTASPTLAGESNYLNILLKFVVCCVSTNRYEELDKFFCNHDLAPYAYNETTVSHIVENEMALLSRGMYTNALCYYKNLNEFGKKVFRNSLFNIIFLEREKDKIIEVLSEISDDEKTNDKLKIYQSFFIDKAVSEDDVVAYTRKYGMEGNHDMLCIMMKCGMDLTKLFHVSDFDPMVCVKRCCDYIVGFYNVAGEYCPEYISHDSEADIVTALKVYEFIMKCAIQSHYEFDSILDTYAAFADCFNEKTEDAPVEVKAARKISEAQAFRKTGNIKECLSKVKETVTVYPNIAPVASVYQETVVKEYEKNKSKVIMTPEMEKLAETLKNSIRNLICKGRYNEAEKYLKEYEKMNPDDSEISELYDSMK